jgi:hypothetical protein
LQISEKLLLHDIDVTLKLVGGSETIYGNNIINDEVNNVEQAVVNSPVLGTYQATITSKTFSENSGSQKVSVVITSGGSVVSRSLVTVTAANTAICPTGEQLITMNLLDRGGDGWPTGASYEIRTLASALFQTGALGSDASQDFNVPVTFCLPASKVYTVNLILPNITIFEDVVDVGLEIPQCKTYLSYYQTSATLDLSTDATLCNPCGANAAAVSMYLADGPLLNHYGWNRNSVYTLSEVSGGDYVGGNETSLLTGTLLYGYVGWVDQCLPTGSYR